MQKGRLPFPLVRISGKFYDTEIGAVVEEFAYAGLDLPFAETLFDFAQQMDPRRPQALDEPATADIQIVLSENASALTYFFASGATDDQITLGKDKYPKIYFAEDSRDRYQWLRRQAQFEAWAGRSSLRQTAGSAPAALPTGHFWPLASTGRRNLPAHAVASRCPKFAVDPHRLRRLRHDQDSRAMGSHDTPTGRHLTWHSTS